MIHVPQLLEYRTTDEYVQALRDAWLAAEEEDPAKKIYLASKICTALNQDQSNRPMFDIVEEWIQDPTSFDTSIR